MKSKFKIAGLTIIIIAVVFGLIAPNVSHALFGILEPVVGGIFRVLGWIITGLSSLILKLSAAIFSAMLKEGFRSYKSAAQGAWTATRDIANMFFILFMIVVAFGTILRNEKYGAKKLLPKIIITALLINFSAVFCYVVIDLTNVAANAFLNMAKNEIRALNQQSDPDIGAAIFDSLKLTGTLMPMDCAKTFDQGFGNCQFLSTPEERAICTENATKNKNDCEKWNEQIQNVKDAEQGIGDVIVAAIMSSVIMLIAAVTFFMSGLVILLRTVFIWVLVALAPLAIACSLLPTLRPNWEKWLKKFLNWCLFAPVFTFFIWLVVKIGTSNQIGAISSSVGGRVNLSTAGAITDFFTGSSTLIRYCIVLATLIIGLMTSKEFGVVGGDMAFNAINKMGKGAAGWAKRTSMRPVKSAGTIVGAKALGLTGKLFGDTKLGRRMRAKATELKTRPEKYPQNVAYERLTSSMSDEDAKKEMMVKAITPEQRIRKLIATRNVARRGLLRDATTNEGREAMKTFKSFNDFEAYQKLKETRPDAIEDKGEQEETTKKVVQEGNLNKIPAIALKDERLVAAIGRFASATQIESLRNASPQHADNLKYSLNTLTTAGNTILAGMSALEQEKIHHSYASQTGDIGRMTNTQLEKWAKLAGADGIKRISSTSPPAAIHIVAENIPTNQLASVVEKIQDNAAAKEIVRYLDTSISPSAAANKKVVRKNPYLKSLIP